ncbi:hypothetical protein [Aurantimonas coralicida]|uniref:hypothetical protein n=1 Tax=Aurantimonas coralicida TaxID=182270 RepID=UPI001E4EF0E3|nr:hypothetical protein [Aurantimonas coralicida]MCD1645614.1 hypothetical protein [Aurantimonas coralicida]
MRSSKIGEMRPATEVLTGAEYHRKFIEDPDRTEYFVPVAWSQTVPLDKAIQELGMFGNQNTVCAPKTPKWRHTVDRLKILFPDWPNGSEAYDQPCDLTATPHTTEKSSARALDLPPQLPRYSDTQ